MVLLRTFGGLRLDGADLNRPQLLLLLAFLALEGSQERRHVAELFWPRAADRMKSLTVALARLRKVGGGVVEADRERVWSQVRCDAVEFLSVLEGRDPARAAELYEGPFAAGFYLRNLGVELEEWVVETREFLAARARAALLELAEGEAGRGQFSAAARRAEVACRLGGAPELEPEELGRFHALLLAGDHPLAGKLGEEARDFGVEVVASRDAARERLAGTLQAREVPSHNLSLRATSFVGRDLELTEVATLLAKPDCRLLTLLGPAGVGKTRLALQVAHEQLKLDSFGGGVYLAELESLADPGLIATAVAGVLGLELQGPADPVGEVARHIGEREYLLVLDNFEQLTRGAVVLSELLAACPRLKLLVTSRERLNLEEERAFEVAGLPFPGTRTLAPAEALRFDAVQLFVQRAKRARSDFELTSDSLPFVLDVCRLVEGLPLGLELAAVWLRVVSVSEVATELESNLDLLATPTRNVPERHRSLRAAFEHSWNLLSGKERVVLARLAVFRGGFRRDAAGEVAGATIPVLASLLDKSLLRADASGRYEFHPLLGQYMREKLAEDPAEQSEVEERHARHYLNFLRGWSQGLKGGRQKAALEALDEERENLRRSWRKAVGEAWVEELQAAAEPLGSFYQIRMRHQEGLAVFSEAASGLSAFQDADPSAVASMLLQQASFCYMLRRFDEASRAAYRAVELLSPDGAATLIARGRNILGLVAWNTGNYEEARSHYQAALAQGGRDTGQAVRVLGNLAILEHFHGNYELAKKHYREVLDLDRQSEDHAGVVQALNNLGHLSLDAMEHEEAKAHFEEALALAREHGIERITPNLLSGLGTVANAQGEEARARELFGKALELASEVGDKTDRAVILVRLGRSVRPLQEADGLSRLLEGLQLAWEINDTPIVLYGFIALAECEADNGRVSRAVQLLSLVSEHPVTKRGDRDAARRMLSAIGEQLPEEERARALESGRAMSLPDVISDLYSRYRLPAIS